MQTHFDWTAGSNMYTEAICAKRNVALSLRNENLPLEDYSPMAQPVAGSTCEILPAHAKKETAHVYKHHHIAFKTNYTQHYHKLCFSFWVSKHIQVCRLSKKISSCQKLASCKFSITAVHRRVGLNNLEHEILKYIKS